MVLSTIKITRAEIKSNVAQRKHFDILFKICGSSLGLLDGIIYIFKLLFYQSQFKLKVAEEEGISRFVLFGLIIYIPAWYFATNIIPNSQKWHSADEENLGIQKH